MKTILLLFLFTISVNCFSQEWRMYINSEDTIEITASMEFVLPTYPLIHFWEYTIQNFAEMGSFYLIPIIDVYWTCLEKDKYYRRLTMKQLKDTMRYLKNNKCKPNEKR